MRENFPGTWQWRLVGKKMRKITVQMKELSKDSGSSFHDFKHGKLSRSSIFPETVRVDATEGISAHREPNSGQWGQNQRA
jgi:hypothetical protein